MVELSSMGCRVAKVFCRDSRYGPKHMGLEVFRQTMTATESAVERMMKKKRSLVEI